MVRIGGLVLDKGEIVNHRSALTVGLLLSKYRYDHTQMVEYTQMVESAVWLGTVYLEIFQQLQFSFIFLLHI